MGEIIVLLVVDAALAAILLGYLYVKRRRERALSDALGHMFKVRIEFMDKALKADDKDSFKMWQQSGCDLAEFAKKVLS